MPHIYAQVTIPHRSLVTADNVVNTFHFTGVDDVEDMTTAIYGRLADFYNDADSPQTLPLKNYLSGDLNPAGTRVKMYDWADPEPRVPVLDESLGVSAATPVDAENLPSEVSLCLSYLSAPESGGRPARRRGRLYLGSFNTGVLQGTSTSSSRPSTTFVGNVVAAGKRLATANTLGAQWVVWSRRDSEAHEIVRGYVDNAWDTQRRRGVPSTSRSVWEVEI